MPRNETTKSETDSSNSSESTASTSTTSRIWKALGVVESIVGGIVKEVEYILPSTVRRTEEGMAENRRALDELKQKIDADALEVQHLVEESQRRSDESQRVSEGAEQQLLQVRAQFNIPTNGNSKTSHTEANTNTANNEEARSANDPSLKK